MNETGIIDRRATLDALSQMGLDVRGVTDKVPDAFLKAVLNWMQGAQNSPTDPATTAFAERQRSAQIRRLADNTRTQAIKSGTLYMNPETRRQMLEATPQGRAILAKEAKKK